MRELDFSSKQTTKNQVLRKKERKREKLSMMCVLWASLLLLRRECGGNLQLRNGVELGLKNGKHRFHALTITRNLLQLLLANPSENVHKLSSAYHKVVDNCERVGVWNWVVRPQVNHRVHLSS